MEAAGEGKVTEVQGLIGCAGVDINHATSGGWTGLWRASFKGHLQIVKLLLSTPGIYINKARTTDGSTPLHAASYYGHADVVKELLAHPQIDVNKAMTTGATPVFMASQDGHADVVKLLLADPRVDPNTRKTNWKDTALIIAAYKERTSVVKLLLRCPKVDTTYKDKEGNTAYDKAYKKGNADIYNAIWYRHTLLQEESHTCN